MSSAHRNTLTFACLLFLAAAARAQSAFENLGDLPGGFDSSRAYGVSPDGQVVVGMSSSDAPGWTADEGFVWTATTGMLPIGDLAGGSFESRSMECTNLPGGIVQCGRGAETNGYAGQVNLLGLIGLGGDAYGSDARALSDDGTRVAGWSVSTLGLEATVWSGAFFTPLGLGDLPGGVFESHAYDISGDGTVVVGWSEGASGSEAFLFDVNTAGPMVGLGDLPGGSYYSKAYGVSRTGSVVVGESSTDDGPYYRMQAVRWTNLGIQNLGGPGSNSVANACSSDGSVIVGNYTGSYGPEAFIWDAQHGMRSLQFVLANDYLLANDLAGWSLLDASDVSDDGKVIVGYGIGPNGAFRAFRATLDVPPLYTFCYGDSPIRCPCGNNVTQGILSGCMNSTGWGGELHASGTPSVAGDSLALSTAHVPATTTVVFIQGSAKDDGGFGTALGDGLRCVTGSVVRLGTKIASGGVASYPEAGNPTISVRGGALPGMQLYYQAYYRNAALYCTPATFNYTNGVAALWSL